MKKFRTTGSDGALISESALLYLVLGLLLFIFLISCNSPENMAIPLP